MIGGLVLRGDKAEVVEGLGARSGAVNKFLEHLDICAHVGFDRSKLKCTAATMTLTLEHATSYHVQSEVPHVAASIPTLQLWPPNHFKSIK